MDCPHCSEPMLEGKVVLGETAAGLLLVGLSYLQMFFLEQDKEPLTVYKPGMVRPACRCRSCGTLILVVNPLDTSRCMQCGSTLEEDETVCSSCGWTYEQEPIV